MTSRTTRQSGEGGSIAFTGGGTAGHVFPGLAVAEEISRLWNGRLFWIGSWGGMEQGLVKDAGMPFFGIPAGKLRRYLSLKNVADVGRVAAGIVAAFRILRRERPAALFSKGGYVSVPPVIAASLLRIPCFTHESDMDPGLATRINARFCREIFVSFERSRDFLPAGYREKAVVTGNPVRSSFFAGSPEEGRRIVGCPPSRPLLLVLGGSLGSSLLNAVVAASLPRLLASCFVVHQIGAHDPIPSAADGYHPAAFFKEEIFHLLAAADIVVGRAGANNLAEFAALSKPSILIPLEAASRGDQVRNAEVFARAGASIVLPEERASADALVKLVQGLLADPGRLAEMGRKAGSLSGGNPAAEIARRILAGSGLPVRAPGAASSREAGRV